MWNCKNMFNYYISLYLQYLIFCNKYDSSVGNPLYGQNVALAQLENFPFIVSIGRINNIVHRNNHFCTGSLISPKHVITSGHCVSGQVPYNLRVKVGTVDLAKGATYNVKSVNTYQDWAEEYHAVSFRHNDVAILELRQEVNETGVKPAPYVQEAPADNFIGETVVTAGWGSADCAMYTTKLHSASLQVIDRMTCAENLERATNEIVDELDGIMCTSANPYAVLGCGDSGGPVVHNGVIIGINEATWPVQEHEDDHSIEQNFHTPLSYYVDFIKEVLDDTISC